MVVNEPRTSEMQCTEVRRLNSSPSEASGINDAFDLFSNVHTLNNLKVTVGAPAGGLFNELPNPYFLR